MFPSCLGLLMLVLAVHPKTKFYPGRLGTRQKLPPIEPAWILRIVFIAFGIAAILEGLWEIHRPR